MNRSTISVLSVIVFWSLGSLCTSVAIGAGEDAEPADELFGEDPAEQAEQVFEPVKARPAEVVESTEVEAQSTEGVDSTEDEQVNVGSFGRIDLHIQDQDIMRVLQMLAIQSERNIVPSSSVSGNISAALYDVDFYEALDAILQPNGFSYVTKGSFIYVYTVQERDEINHRNRKVETVVVRLSYLTSADAAKFLQPMISAAGSITVSGEDKPGFDTSISDAGTKGYAHHDMLVIRDYPEVIEEMKQVLKQLDVRPPQIQIEVTILEARLSEDNAFGVDLSILADFDMDEFTNPLSQFNDLITGVVSPSGQTINTTVGNTVAGSGGVKIGILSNDVAAFVRALDQVTDTTVLANPTIQTLNRHPAKLISGAKLGYISTIATETSTTQTVEFLEVGTQLLVRPFVCEDDFIRLEVRPEISEGEVRSIDGFVIPDETTNELIANVIVPNGKAIVLGGLFKEDTTVSRNQVPFVAGIPLIGEAFKGQDDIVRRTEVIFILRPTIIKDVALLATGDQAMGDMERVVMGTRRGLLPWSRTKLTTKHLRDAYELLRQGRKDKALWSINMAIALDPTIHEGIRLREELTEERLFGADRGILGKTIARLIDEQLSEDALEAQAASFEAEEEADDTADNDAIVAAAAD